MSVEFVFILPISIGLQFVAAYLAFRLIRTATGGPAWAFVAAALFLMGVSRSVGFYQMLESGADHAVRVAELVALLISALMVVGMALIGPLFSATRRAERRLRQSERRTRSIEGQLDDAIESISEGFALFDADGRLVVCNSRYKEFYGYADADARPGVHTRDLGLLDLERGTVIHDGESGDYLDRRDFDRHLPDTFIIHLKDGRILETRDRKTTSGGIVSVQEDVTERKRAEAARDESEVRFHAIFENSTAGIGRSRLVDGSVLWANQKLAQMFGYDSTEEFVADFRFSEHFASSADRERLIKNYIKNPTGAFEVNYVSGDGSIITELTSGKVNRKAGYIDFVMIDITERKQAEEALRESEQRLRDIAESASDWFWEMDENLYFTYHSPRYYEITGFQPNGLRLTEESV